MECYQTQLRLLEISSSIFGVPLELLISLKTITMKSWNEIQQVLVKSRLDFYLICIQIHWGRSSSEILPKRALCFAGVLVADCLAGWFECSLSLWHQDISGENSHWYQLLLDAAGGNETNRSHASGPFLIPPLLWNDWMRYLWEFVKGFWQFK